MSPGIGCGRAVDIPRHPCRCRAALHRLDRPSHQRSPGSPHQWMQRTPRTRSTCSSSLRIWNGGRGATTQVGVRGVRGTVKAAVRRPAGCLAERAAAGQPGPDARMSDGAMCIPRPGRRGRASVLAAACAGFVVSTTPPHMAFTHLARRRGTLQPALAAARRPGPRFPRPLSSYPPCLLLEAEHLHHGRKGLQTGVRGD